MARTGRPKAELTVTDQERATLERWARRPKSAQALALRRKIVLACAGGRDEQGGGRRSRRAHQVTVGKWRARFIERRLDGLSDETRPGLPRKITDDKVEEVIVKTLEEAPPGNDTHWSTRSMAKTTGMSQTAVGADLAGVRAQAAPAADWKLSSTRCSSRRSATLSGCT